MASLFSFQQVSFDDRPTARHDPGPSVVLPDEGPAAVRETSPQSFVVQEPNDRIGENLVILSNREMLPVAQVKPLGAPVPLPRRKSRSQEPHWRDIGTPLGDRLSTITRPERPMRESKVSSVPKATILNPQALCDQLFRGLSYH